MHLDFDRKFVVLVVIIVLIIAGAIAWFRFKYCTQEERDANRTKFMLATAVLVALAIGIYLLTVYACQDRVPVAGEAGELAGQEYGIREAISKRWAAAKAERDARAAAKKENMTPEQIREAGRQAKENQRWIKREGQRGGYKAEEAARKKVKGDPKFKAPA